MQRYKLKYIEKIEIADKTYAFKLEKPDDFTFVAGQYMEVYHGANSHTFSIASSPNEDFLMFATRIREGSSYKERLMKLKEGEIVEIEGPFGSFTLPREKAMPVVILAGGIGITPVRSMVKSDEHSSSERSIKAFYSNRRPEDAAFLHELESVALKNFRLIPTMTNLDESKSEWNGETGYITIDMIEKYLTSWSEPMFYIVGPPSFVLAINNLLSSNEKIPSTHIKAEDFAGYN